MYIFLPKNETKAKNLYFVSRNEKNKHSNVKNVSFY